MSPLTILYATDTGNAEIASFTLLQAPPAQRTVTAAHNIADMEPADFAALSAEVLLICSTCDDGNLAAGAREVCAALTSTPLDLTHLRFWAFGLGDSVYSDTYNLGCTKMISALETCGARLMAPPTFHDATDGSDPVRAVQQWAEDTLAAAVDS